MHGCSLDRLDCDTELKGSHNNTVQFSKLVLLSLLTIFRDTYTLKYVRVFLSSSLRSVSAEQYLASLKRDIKGLQEFGEGQEHHSCRGIQSVEYKG